MIHLLIKNISNQNDSLYACVKSTNKLSASEQVSLFMNGERHLILFANENDDKPKYIFGTKLLNKINIHWR